MRQGSRECAPPFKVTRYFPEHLILYTQPRGGWRMRTTRIAIDHHARRMREMTQPWARHNGFRAAKPLSECEIDARRMREMDKGGEGQMWKGFRELAPFGVPRQVDPEQVIEEACQEAEAQARHAGGTEEDVREARTRLFGGLAEALRQKLDRPVTESEWRERAEEEAAKLRRPVGEPAWECVCGQTMSYEEARRMAHMGDTHNHRIPPSHEGVTTEGLEAIEGLTPMMATMHRGLLKNGMSPEDASQTTGAFLAQFMKGQAQQQKAAPKK